MKRLIRNIQLREDISIYQHNTKSSAIYIYKNKNDLVLIVYDTKNIKPYIKNYIKGDMNAWSKIPEYLIDNDEIILNYIDTTKLNNPVNSWKVNRTSAKKGTGYTMYLFLMSLLPDDAYVVSDRGKFSSDLKQDNRDNDKVSDSAQKVWKRLYNEPDVSKQPIDNIEKPITPNKFDDGPTLYKLTNPKDITTTDFLDYMYKLKSSDKASINSNMNELQNSHENFINTLIEELIEEGEDDSITSYNNVKSITENFVLTLTDIYFGSKYIKK